MTEGTDISGSVHRAWCFDWWCTVYDPQSPAEAEKGVKDREKELRHPNAKMYELPMPAACCEHRLSHRPAGNTLFVAPLSRRTLKRNYLRWSL